MADKPWAPPSATEVVERWKLVQDDMIDIRRNYLLNTSFFHGDQWVRWDDSASTVNIMQFLSDQEGQARATVNKLKPRFISLLARLCRTPLSFENKPEGVDSFALQKARLGDQVLEVKAHRDGWAKVRRHEVRDALMGGVAGVIVEPGYLYEDDEISDGLGGTIKVPSQPAPSLRSLSGIEFGLEPGTTDERDALWCIINTTLTPGQTKRAYNLPKEPPTDSDAAQGAMLRALRSNRRGSTNARGCMVLVYYEKPTDKSPGIVLHVTGGKIVKQTNWPYPFKDLPVTTFTETEIAGTWKGDTRMNDARQLQMQINKAYTTINANLGRTDNARLLMPDGAVSDGEDDLTGVAGEVVHYDQDRGKPYWLEAPQIPRWLREHIQNLEGELDDLFSTHAVSRGQAPGDRNSGLALSILAEKDETPLGIIAEDQQRGWQRIAEHVLMLERWLLQVVDAGTADQQDAQPMQVSDVVMSQGQGDQRDGSKEVTWSAEDLCEHPVVHVPMDAVQPRSKAAVQDVMLKLATTFPTMFAQLGPAQMAAILEVDDVAAFTHISDPHIENANWENARMAAGADETVVEITDWQPHAIHIVEHNRFRASASYRDADDQTRKFIDVHVQAHEKLLLDQHNAEMAQQAQQALALDPNAGQGVPSQSQPNKGIAA